MECRGGHRTAGDTKPIAQQRSENADKGGTDAQPDLVQQKIFFLSDQR